jgi:hypothetical protein
MPSLQVVRPVVGRRVIVELPDDWGDVQTVDVTLKPHQAAPAEEELPEEEYVSPLYKALEEAGFVGCIEADEQLSTTYKQKLDFARKYGEQK